ncbi:MAG: hypothetical protein ACRDOF_01060 [Gaiellaceae bacterium]
MVAAFAPLLADAAEEGKDVILSMLVVGLVFVGAILVGDLWNWRGRKRH